MTAPGFEWHDACCRVIAAAREYHAWYSLQVAATYAVAGKDMHSAAGRKAQALYILDNIQRWRGPEATEVRAILRRYAK